MSSHRTERTAQPEWRKASPSGHGACIEVAMGNDVIFLRDSRKPSFVLAVKAGEFDDLAKLTDNRKNAVQRPTNGHSESVREKSAPKNWLDLADRILIRATSSWRSCLMHLSFLAAAFAVLGLLAHAATGVSPWVAAVGTVGGGAVAGGTAYARSRANKPVKNDDQRPS
jgi:hypothetical protein